MASVDLVLAALRQELVDANLVRRPSEAGAHRPMHIAPIEGPPAPGEREGAENDADLVFSIFDGGTYAEGPYDASTRRRYNLDIRSRARNNAGLREAMVTESLIVLRLIRPATNYGFGFTIGAGGTAPVFCQEVQAAGGGPISSSREAGFDRVLKIMLEVAP